MKSKWVIVGVLMIVLIVLIASKAKKAGTGNTIADSGTGSATYGNEGRDPSKPALNGLSGDGVKPSLMSTVSMRDERKPDLITFMDPSKPSLIGEKPKLS